MRSCRRPRRTLALLGVLLLGLLPPASTAAEHGGPVRRVVIVSGSTGGIYYSYGLALARELAAATGVRARVVATQGSVENLRALVEGTGDIAFSAADAVTETGLPPGEPVGSLRAIGRLYDDYLHVVVPASSPVRELGDLRGRTVSIGSAGSGTELIARRILEPAGLGTGGIRPVSLGLGDSAAAMLRGEVDAFFWSGGLPTRAVSALAAELPIRLLPLGNEAASMRATHGSAGYRVATVPGGTYADVPQTRTLAVPNYLLVRADADPAVVAWVTRLLFERSRTLAEAVPVARSPSPRTAIFTDPVPLHPGALAYYRAIKP
ncbi:TAXI family TRAP transporter solute-binding subunit [Prauserella flavalba]|uniref:C4-dicarboxylate ABC transporter substrate-binding protein n=1 Tax=Prauserella flavalba TaxID=1477506 RepID=A0A318MCK9_9PSEU|nr:TAXI family TRAP transporter solute-binding subunit [Prauserella flavalba]PXY36619.1 hypothetical protein BA062_14710 [Prauserella flavalba]